MNIMDLFRGANNANNVAPAPQPQNNQQQPQPPQPGNQQQQQQHVADPSAIDALNKKPQSSLDEFTKLFTMSEDEQKRVSESGQTPDFFNIDPDKLGAEVKNMSFMGNSPEAQALAQKALGGDQQALFKLLDSFGQSVFQRAAMLSATLANKAGRGSVETVQTRLPSLFRDLSSKSETVKLNPEFAHPSLQPLVELVRSQAQLKYPDASPDQIAAMVNNYMKAAGSALSRNDSPQPQNQQQPTETNFEDFFGFGTKPQ